MFLKPKAAALAAVASLALLAGCDSGSSVTNKGTDTVKPVVPAPTPTPAPEAAPTPAPTPAPAPAPFTTTDASRLAKQATFGATPELVAEIERLGAAGWVDQQLSLSTSSYSDMARAAVRRDFCNGAEDEAACKRQHFSRTPVAMRFYANAIGGSDQLRQRVAFALGQLIVTSELEVYSTDGIAAFQQILLDHSFGNYRDLLHAVTMNGYMGDYLDMSDSSRWAPSENYARELLQLFSMGPDRLNMDGTPALDATGTRIPNYTTDDIIGVAGALTGWTQSRLNGAPISDWYARDYTSAMIPKPNQHLPGTKSFLGRTVQSGASQTASLAAVLDTAFQHPSTAPYVSRFLIQHLVTSNPSPAYVARVAAVFADNGSGVRGDLKAVVRAILLDGEARNAPVGDAGKLKEPILLMTSLARAIGFRTDGFVFVRRDASLGQGVFRSPSVFNFYPPDYPLPGSAFLKSPVSKLMTTSGAVQWHNLIYNWTVQGDANRSEYALDAGVPMASGTHVDWSAWEALGSDLDAMIARVDLLLLANSMTPAQKSALRAAAEAITDKDPTAQARRRAQMMLYIVASSPLFLVDR